MNGGRIICEGKSSYVGRVLKETDDPMLSAMPTPMRVYLALERDRSADCVSKDCKNTVGTLRENRTLCHGARAGNNAQSAGKEHIPETVREGRLYLEEKCLGAQGANSAPASGVKAPAQGGNPPLISLREVWFRYEREGLDVVKDLSLSACAGEFICVVGGNGTGKSTMLGIITGENRYYRGKARVLGLDPKKAKGRELTGAGLSVLPQDPQTLFTRSTVFDNLIDVAAAHKGRQAVPEEIESEVRHVCELTDITNLAGFHPYDISGGEQQRAGLAMALLTKPKLLLLDEPTKGMDSFFKEKLAGILKRLIAEGMTVLMVSHDIEFCAKYAGRCALFFAGGIVSENAPREFFSGNSFYTTAANRMSRHIRPGLITTEDVIGEFSK
jgi:energy-coupling factor transport system ATP-binding protein